MKTKIIQITKADIKEAKRLLKRACSRANECCPMALAVQRALRTEWRAGVSAIYTGAKRISLPAVASEFIHKFDHQEPVKPMRFTLKIK